MRRSVISVWTVRFARAALVVTLAAGVTVLAGAQPSGGQGPPSLANSSITLSSDIMVLSGEPASSTVSATVTLEDASGNPVPNDQVIMVLLDTTAHENISSSITNNGQESTDANGQATYTIPCGCSPGDQLQISAADGSENISAFGARR
jgi:hypothetical protein